MTVLPDYSLVGDPLCTAGLITHRPISGDDTTVTLLMVTRNVAVVPPALRDMQAALLDRARAYQQDQARPAAVPHLVAAEDGSVGG